MQKVGTREFKNRIGRYLRAVKSGQTVIITDRGKTVAHVTPPPAGNNGSSLTVEERLSELDAQGLIRLGVGQPLPKFKAIKNQGKAASKIIIEERR